MSNLAGMLAKFCPNGVEFKKIADVTTVARGIRVVRNQLAEKGEFPVYQNSMKPLGYYEKANCPAKTTFVIAAGAAGEIGYCYVDFWAADDCYYFIHTRELDSRYLYHVLLSRKSQIRSKVRKASVPRLARAVVENLVIPVPPIEIQYEIARLLDNFTELIVEFTAELTAELTARKKQYEYYRNELFKFDNEITYVALGDICDVTAGGTPSKQRKEYWDNGIIKWLGSTVCKNQKSIDEITNYITRKGFEESSAKMMKKNTTLIALVGATIGKIAFLPFEATINQNIAGVYPKDTKVLDPDYLYYACAGLYSKFTALTQNSKLSIANLSFVRSLQIPVPSFKVQKQIVNVLDRFDILCNDLANGLLAEIEARQKQYEYYRNKLLSFKELSE